MSGLDSGGLGALGERHSTNSFGSKGSGARGKKGDRLPWHGGKSSERNFGTDQGPAFGLGRNNFGKNKYVRNSSDRFYPSDRHSGSRHDRGGPDAYDRERNSIGNSVSNYHSNLDRGDSGPEFWNTKRNSNDPPANSMDSRNNYRDRRYSPIDDREFESANRQHSDFDSRDRARASGGPAPVGGREPRQYYDDSSEGPENQMSMNHERNSKIGGREFQSQSGRHGMDHYPPHHEGGFNSGGGSTTNGKGGNWKGDGGKRGNKFRF